MSTDGKMTAIIFALGVSAAVAYGSAETDAESTGAWSVARVFLQAFAPPAYRDPSIHIDQPAHLRELSIWCFGI